MTIKIVEDNANVLESKIGDCAIWQENCLLNKVTSTLNLTAFRGTIIVGRWIVPTKFDGNYYRAERQERFLPYASPLLLDKHPYARRETFYYLLKFLMDKFKSIQLPMEPSFNDLGCLNELGGFAEARHTYIIDPKIFISENCLRRTRRALSYASRKAIVRVHKNTDSFQFNKAIIASESSVINRANFAKFCHEKGKVLIVDAIVSNVIQGQLLLVNSGKSWIVMHSWSDRKGVNGIANFLIAETCYYLRDSNLPIDLEGSIIYGIDRFMAGMGTPITFPIIYWAKDSSELFAMLKDSHLIPGRIFYDSKE